MEMLQIPTYVRDRNGQLMPRPQDVGKLLFHHIQLMEEGDWYTKWTQPDHKQGVRVNIANLDDPLINEIFEAYRQEVDQHKELGTPILNPNPRDAICGYIYNCYSYPKDDSDILVPAGFIVEVPDVTMKKRLRRIEQKVEARKREQKVTKKDELFEEYENHLLSKGIDDRSKEYAEKVIQYWEDLGRRHNPLLGDTFPSRSKETILRTAARDYSIKAVRSRCRYIKNKHTEFYMEWVMSHPQLDIQQLDTRKKMIVDFDGPLEEEEDDNV